MSLDNEEVAELEEIIAAVSEMRSQLSSSSRGFLDDISSRYEEYGAELRLSPRQWDYLRSLRSRA